MEEGNREGWYGGDSGHATGEPGARVNPRSPNEALQPEIVQGPRRSRRARGKMVTFLSGVFTFLVLCVIAAGAALFVGKHEFEAPGPLERDIAVVVPRGQGVQGIADALQRHGVIAQSWLFVAGATLHKASRDLKAGEYLFPERVSMHEAMEILREGKGISHQVTIPEGLTSKQIVARLNEDPILIGEITEIPPEGTMLPETYKFDRGTSRAQLVARMQQAHNRVVEQAWNRRMQDLPLKNKQELITLASIVEKETGRADERPRVAGVFINRLKKRMRLQSDPTIIYGLVGGDGALGRPILRSEIDRPTPYNTYHINGLPPTPIANPGQDAIEAVANPSRTEELYFVADGTGGHVFANSLEEHNRNVARWREISARRAAEQAEAEKLAAKAAAEKAAEDEETAENEEAAPPARSLRGLNTSTPASSRR